MPAVAASKDKKGFVLDPSGRPFVPWGFNYDHDDKGRLIEDYWEDEWPTAEAHFGQMKKLGANVVRVHLQLGKFMDGPDKPNVKALDRLGKLLELAERLRPFVELNQERALKASGGAIPRTAVGLWLRDRVLGLVPLLRWLHLPLEAGMQRAANALTLAALPSPLSASRVPAEG
jgi:hypothetical protein